MTRWQDYADHITASNLNENRKNIEDPPTRVQVFLGPYGFELLEPQDVTDEFVAVTKQVFDEMVDDKMSNPSTPEDELVELASLKQRSISSESSPLTSPIQDALSEILEEPLTPVVEQTLYSDSMLEQDAKDDPSWQGECDPSRVEYLFRTRTDGNYILYSDAYDDINCSFLSEGKVKTVLLYASSDMSSLEEMIEKHIPNPIPIKVKPLSFYQGQLDFHATQKEPKDVLSQFNLPGACCITRTKHPNHFIVHVIMPDHHIEEFPVTTDDSGIHAVFQNTTGDEINIIEVERIRDLFDNEDFPANFFPYGQFEYQGEIAHTIEEIYYRSKLEEIPSKGTEFHVVHPKFSATPIAVDKRGTFIELIKSTVHTLFAGGSFKEVHKTTVHPSSTSDTEYFIVKGKPARLIQFETTVRNIKLIRNKLTHPKYNLLPHVLIETEISGKRKEGLLTKKALGGTLKEYIGKLDEKQQLKVALDLFLGLKELDDVGIIKGDIKPDNILCLTKDLNNLQAKQADFDEIMIKGVKRDKRPIASPFYTIPSIMKKKVPTQDTYQLNAIYSIGTTLFRLVTEQYPRFGRSRINIKAGDPLQPQKTYNSSELFKDAIKPIQSWATEEVRWKEKDSLARIIWDCIFIDQPNPMISRPINIKTAIKRIKNLIKS